MRYDPHMRRPSILVLYLLPIGALVCLLALWVVQKSSYENARDLAKETAPPPSTMQPTRTVRGRVIDENGQPIGGVTLRVPGRVEEGASAVSNTAGRFELQGVGSELSLIAYKDGYYNQTFRSGIDQIRLASLPSTDNERYSWVASTPHWDSDSASC